MSARPPERLFVERDPATDRRRRSAPAHEETSDERRFAGIAIAVIVGAFATLLAIGWVTTPRALRSPGPLAEPHRAANLTCAQCHDDAPIAQACVGCHGPHPSTRAPHTRLRADARLSCTSCHRVHRDFGGVAVQADGSVVRFGPGAEQPVDVHAPTGVGPGIVPVIPVSACTRCHDAAAPRDPIARCLGPGAGTGAAEDPARPTLCFDEHRDVTAAGLTSDPKLRARVGLHAVARRALAKAPAAPVAPPPDRPGWWLLGVGLTTSLATWSGVRGIGWLRRRRRRAAVRADVPAAALRPAEVRKLPAIDTATCIGCYACVDVCPYDVLAVRDYVAVVVRPDDCCGLTLCEQRCPNGSLRITEGEAIGDRPRLDTALQSQDTPGVYLAGDVTGLPLIRNAIAQGQAAIEAIVADLRRSGPAPELGADAVDVAIVGAGPAGLSAALAAVAARLRYVVLEQGSMAESIRSFPRGKLVFDQPLGLPLVGPLWLAESTKEELVSKWIRIVREHDVRIAEGVRVAAVERQGAGFVVTPAEGTPIRARRVLLAMGRRGTPRKLACAVPDACLDRVHYHLADARTFAGRRVVIVGLGDVAMEAAIALANQPGTTVEMVARGDDFRRGKQRNIDAVRRLVDAGRVRMHWGASVVAVRPDAVALRRAADAAAAVELPWDALLVMIGAIAPWDFLARAGVHRADAVPSRPGADRSLPIVQSFPPVGG